MITSLLRLRCRLLSSVVPALVLSASLLDAGCVIKPEPLSAEDNLAWVRKDLSVVLAPQEPLSQPISMHEAMARAIKYNLDERVKIMETAVASQQLDLSQYDMLPRVVASAGYTGRSNDAGSESLNLATGRRTGESTTAVDRHRRTGDLGFTWNVLDFGVSYLRARQNANLVLIAEERCRRVVQGILQDVRTAYWRAVAAERLLERIAPLEKRVEGARYDARTLEALRVQAPLQALGYTRSLVETLRQLQSLRRELAASKSQLGALMGLPPGEPFEVELPSLDTLKAPPKLDVDVEALETYALLSRPELLEESYNQRISADETWRLLLRLLPGIDVNAALRYDSNSFLVNQRWADYGARIGWSLINIVSAPNTRSYAEAQEDLVALRRQALSVAVLSQVRVAMLQFRELNQEFGLTAEQADLDGRIRTQYANSGEAGQIGELGVIQAEVTALLSDLRRDLVFADLHNAYAQVMVSAGVDPLPDNMVPSTDLASLTKAIDQGLDSWQGRANSALRVKDLVQKGAVNPEPQPAVSEAPKATSPVPAAAAPVAEVALPAPAAAVPVTWPPAWMPATGSFSPTIQVDLGAYTRHTLAKRDWDTIAKRLGSAAKGKDARFITSRRSVDGQPIVQLRVGGFNDRAAAERFCQGVRGKQQECIILTVTAMRALPMSPASVALS